MCRLLWVSGLLILSALARAEPAPAYFVVTFEPGQKWVKTLTMDSQPGYKEHRLYLELLHRENAVVMEGRLGDSSKSMMVLRAESLDEANRIAAGDPGVISRVLTSSVVPWRVGLSSLPHLHRVIPEVSRPDKPFMVERIGPDGPINLPDGKKN